MSGTAQVCEIAVREKFTDASESYVLHFNPPLADDQFPAPQLWEYGIGVTTRGVSDVFAMDPTQPGRCLRVETMLSDESWVSLLNCVSIDGQWTVATLLEHCGYEVLR